MKNIDFYQIGIRIRDERTAKNITQDQLAAIIDSDRAVIARIESGVKKCSVEFLINIANALEVPTDALLIDCLDTNRITASENRIHVLLSDCSDEEIAILVNNFCCLRDILKKFEIN